MDLIFHAHFNKNVNLIVTVKFLIDLFTIFFEKNFMMKSKKKNIKIKNEICYTFLIQIFNKVETNVYDYF